MTENEIAKEIVDAAFKIHKQLGPGLLEAAYEAAMAFELQKRNLRFVVQQPIPVIYESVRLERFLKGVQLPYGQTASVPERSDG